MGFVPAARQAGNQKQHFHTLSSQQKKLTYRASALDDLRM